MPILSMFGKESMDMQTFTADLKCHVSFMLCPDNK